jgi:hypothetical protein
MTISLWLQRRRALLLRRPFPRLVVHFGQRLFSGGDEAGEGQMSLGVGALLAILATPGLFISVLLFDKYSSLIRFFRGGAPFDPYAQSLPDQYFFFTFSMVITGVVTVLKWDSILPDRRDYMNLAPLPISTRNIFLANLVAIVTTIMLFIVDVNAASIFLFPMLVTMERGTFFDFLRFVGIEAAGVMLSSLFIFSALFALIGGMMAVLPSQVFRKVSLYLRVAVVMAMLGLLASSFAIPRLLHDSASGAHWFVRWLPPVWFLGFARSLIGRANQPLTSLGLFGIRVLFAAMALAAAAYALSYYRYFMRIPETLDIAIRPRGPRQFIPSWILDRLLLRSPFERACYPFALKTLARNERQSLIFGGFVGLGLVMASQTLVSAFNHGSTRGPLPNVGMLSIPLILAYFVLCGSRFVFDMPAELQANWAPQVIVDRKNHDAGRVARKTMLTLVWPGIVLIGLPVYTIFWGWHIAAGHIAVTMVCTYCLADFLLHGFRKIPFTCTYSPWKQHATVAIILYALGFGVFTSIPTGLEHALLPGHAWTLWLLAAAILGAWEVFRRFRQDALDPTELIFAEATPPPFEILNLSGK